LSSPIASTLSPFLDIHLAGRRSSLVAADFPGSGGIVGNAMPKGNAMLKGGTRSE
jgi:hypothetical protein